MDHDRLDRLFAALADPTRRRIAELLGERQPRSTSALTAQFPVSRWAVMKHLAVLRDASLIETLPQGRRRLHFLDPRLIEEAQAWLAGLR
jgi:DNA-binding transcriptional ArsR family regulator